MARFDNADQFGCKMLRLQGTSAVADHVEPLALRSASISMAATSRILEVGLK